MQKNQHKAVLAKGAWLQDKIGKFSFCPAKTFKSVWQMSCES